MTGITKLHERLHPDGAFWVLEGRITREDAVQMEQGYRRLSPEQRARLCINLERVTSMDEEVVEILIRMHEDNVYLEGATPLIRERIRRRVGAPCGHSATLNKKGMSKQDGHKQPIMV